MIPRHPSSRLPVLLLAFTELFALAAPPAARSADKVPPPFEALIYSTMPSTAAHSPEMALDGDPHTYFKSVYGMDDGDDFLVLLSHPVRVRSIRVITGDDDGQDGLTDGYIETAPDETHFTKAASFDNSGVAAADLHRRSVQSIRIRVNRRRSIPTLLVREINIDSGTPITHVQMGPGRGFHDLSQAPDLTAWAAKAEQQMEDFWPDTDALLYSDKFIPPNMVNVIYRTGPGVTGVAATGGGVMTVNSAWCRKHPEDTGLTVHETAHVIQAYRSYNPVWLIEGIADYIRWVKFEPENQHAGINVRTATYHDSYRTTATFLGWCELHYDSRLVTKLSNDVRFGHYSKDLWQKYCGKDVDTLWAEFISAYKADPAHIIIPIIPPADRPRALPTVAPGASTPVDLSAAFNAVGLTNDGATFGDTSGFDAGGAAYSAQLFGSTGTWKNIVFNFGPAGAPDTVTARGQVIQLPAGQYSSLWLLGAAVQGAQTAQSLTVTYSDGSTQPLAQNFSDWAQPQRFPGESRAARSAYRNMADGTKDSHPFYAYSYGFTLDPAKTIRSLTLPDNPYVRILAITLAK